MTSEAKVRVEHQAVLSGYQGPPTLGELQQALTNSGAPASAQVRVSTDRGDQRDPGGWKLTLTWTI